MRLRSTAAAGLLLTAGLSLGVTGTANAADLDCSNFATQQEAQAVFNADPSDPNGLDSDDDGIACESLASGGTAEDGTITGAAQVSTPPAGGVSAGDGSSSTSDAGVLPYALGGLAFTAAAGAAVAARRSSRASA